jgi:hypothetical protein
VTVEVQDTDDDGHLLFDCEVSGVATVVYTTDEGLTWQNENGETVVPDDTPTPKMVEKEVTTDEIASITYEDVYLTLLIPNFNLAVTDDLKSAIHKFVVDYVMARFLQDQVTDKAGEYKALADGEDYSKIVSDLNCRDKYTMRHPSFM